ncbi:MAG: hypothetical protein JXO51_11155 [Candidatus Aminicenantes bacterium]|nr:hypothetical protein [Candidatus Aminicenantes bacterium]
MKTLKLILIMLALGFGAVALRGQSVTVTSPNGGERWDLGTTQPIAWSHSGVSGNVRINLVNAGGGPVGTIATVPVTDGRYSWEAGRLSAGTAPAGEYRIGLYVSSADVDDRSDGTFFLVAPAEPGPEPEPEPQPPALRLMAPNGGEVLDRGTTRPVVWRFKNLSRSALVRLELFKDGLAARQKLGVIAEKLSIGEGGAGTYAWDVGIYKDGKAPGGDNCYFVKVSTMDGVVADVSDRPFSIHPLHVEMAVPAEPVTPAASIEVSSPLAALTLSRNFTIAWRAQGVDGNLVINILKESGGTYTIATGVDSGRATGHFTWIVGQLASSASRFPRVDGERFRFQIGGRGAIGESRWFEIVRPELRVTEPHAGEHVRRGDRKTIRWIGDRVQGNVHIDVYYDMHRPGYGIAKYERLFSNVSNLGHREWTVWPRPRAGQADIDPPPRGDDVRWFIRVISARLPWLYDDGDEFILE